ncbi:hypothetical protein [Methanobrevibacter millerae]|uniref:Uncharacterized protein n=1 Tax=Methanobrevibacter millerae TaxID=230361 RepID=A0A1G5V9Y6_9EURY|nr:hypothetical protein [Methanobrevibacter millerae]SDA42448.1 hypothetical protein SAMN02910315_00447 [Methanobrevibacter millerae]
MHIKGSRLVLVVGVLSLLTFVSIVYNINPNLEIFINPKKYVFNISSISLAYFSVLIAIAALFHSSEMTAYAMKYEKSKNSSIRLFNIVRYISPIFSPETKLKLLNYILDDTFHDKEFEEFLVKWKTVPMKINGVVEEDIGFLDNLIIFKRDYELYYLPEKLLLELRYILRSKNELNQNDINTILKVIKKHVKKEFNIKL